LMTLPAFTTNANGAWAVGTGNGCFASGQQIKAVAGAASTTLVLATYGWIDTRSRFN
jgi:hypothetical protein